MTFLNGSLAFGALAFAIPLIIHILNRSRFRTVEWGAMHLLESVIKVNHKRFRIDQLILLLVRCAIPVLLALCLATPVLTGARLLEGDAPVSLVILLDTSYSMDTVDASGSRFDSAVDAACAIVGAASRGSEVAVIQTGGRPTPLFDQPVFDPEAVIRKLKQVPAGYGASDMQASLDEALATLSGMKHARRELIVISDFQPADWEAIGANAAESILRQVEAMSIKPELTLLPIGKPVDGNISVDSLEFPRRALGVGQQLAVRANVKNHGVTAIDHARVILRIDGTESSVSQTALGPNGTTQVLFPCTFDTAGSRRTVQTVPQGKMQLARFDGTQRPGVYAMSMPSTATIHFVAETSREESNLSGLDEPGLVSLAKNTASTLIKSPAEYLELDRLRRHGQEIWKYVLAAFLAFMFLELVLQQRFARVRA